MFNLNFSLETTKFRYPITQKTFELICYWSDHTIAGETQSEFSIPWISELCTINSMLIDGFTERFSRAHFTTCGNSIQRLSHSIITHSNIRWIVSSIFICWHYLFVLFFSFSVSDTLALSSYLSLCECLLIVRFPTFILFNSLTIVIMIDFATQFISLEKQRDELK